MSRKNADHRPSFVVECLIVAGLVLALVVTGVAAVGFGVNDLFSSVRLP